MTITAVDYWSIIDAGGTEIPLSTLAYNISTWGDDRQGVIPLRGEDQKIPWIPGLQENDRVPDSRSFNLGMWVIGADEDGEVPVGTTRRMQFEANWRMLQRVFWNKGRIYTLRKRFHDEAGTLQTADARVRYADGMSPSMMGQFGAKFTVTLFLADPFFYGSPVVIPFDTSVDTSWEGTILGTYDSRKILIEADTSAAGVTTPNVSCSSLLPESLLSLDYKDTETHTLVIDCANQTFRVDGANASGLTSHFGYNDWLRLNEGAATILFDRNDGNWSGTLTYYPTWI